VYPQSDEPGKRGDNWRIATIQPHAKCGSRPFPRERRLAATAHDNDVQIFIFAAPKGGVILVGAPLSNQDNAGYAGLKLNLE
jgi:hypothetical protein